MSVALLAPPSLVSVQYRLARYYIGRLRAADAAFRRGHENALSGLALFDFEWSQIKHCQAWAAQHAAGNPAIARLCVDFTQAGEEILLFRQTPSDWLQWLEVGLKAAIFLGDSFAEMLHCFLLGRVHMHLGATDRALAFTESALALAQQLGDPLYMSRSLRLIGGLFYMQDQYDRAQTASEQALALGQEIGAKLEVGMALNGLGNIAMSQSRDEQALEYYRRYLQIAEALGRPIDITVALYNLSLVLTHMGDYPAAVTYAERCVALCRSTGNRRFLAQSLGSLGQLADARHSLPEAKDYFEQSLEMARAIGHHSHEAFMLLELGYLRYRLGEIRAALEHLETSYALANTIGDRWYAALAVMNIVEVFRGTGDLPRAHAKLREGLKIVRSFENSAIRARYLLQAALLWRDKGLFEQAALWEGLLEKHTHELNGEQHQRLAGLKASLEAQLAHEEFVALTERGSVDDLTQVIEELMHST